MTSSISKSGPIIKDPSGMQGLETGDSASNKTKDSSLPSGTLPNQDNSVPSAPIKERKKPRKLIRRTPISPTTQEAPEGSPSTPELTGSSLDSRMSILEQKYHAIDKRLDTNAREIGILQAATKTKPSKRTGGSPKEDKISMLDNPKINTQSSGRGEQPRKVQQRVIDLDEEDVETIPRLDASVAEQRSVALTGNYKIPLPPNLSIDDVRAIQEGLNAAGSVAREIGAAIRTSSAQGNQNLENQESNLPAATGNDAGITKVPQSPRGWSSFLNDCSKLVANAANAVEVDAAIEAKKHTSSQQTPSAQSPSAMQFKQTTSQRHQTSTTSSRARQKHGKDEAKAKGAS